MGNEAASERIDTASRVILAAPRSLVRAFVDPEMLASWRAPEGMSARIDRFVAGSGGGYRITLTYPDGGPDKGKSGPRVDIADVRFIEFVAEERIVEEVRFVSDDPALAAPMRVTTSFEPVADGTKVTMAASAVPASIAAEDHRAGMASALRNLALLTE